LGRGLLIGTGFDGLFQLFKQGDLRGLETIFQVLLPDGALKRTIGLERINVEQIAGRADFGPEASRCFRVIPGSSRILAVRRVVPTFSASATMHVNDAPLAHHKNQVRFTPFQRNHISIPLPKSILHIHDGSPAFLQ
jgi:hypothetical protein